MRSLRTVKIILTVAIVLLAIIAAIVATHWQSLLSPAQKLHYGLVFNAADDYAKAARENPTDPEALSNYVDVLVRKGNLGRAYYLSQLYGVKNEKLDALREVVEKGIGAASKDRVYALGDDAAVLPYGEDPLRQALRYAEGYHHALLGDWMSAKNFFNAIEPKKLAPELHLHYRYYLARCYRMAGDDKEQAQVEGLFKEVIDSGDPVLAPRAAYNLVAWYLAQPDADEDWPDKYATAEAGLKAGESTWAEQKIDVEIGQHALAADDIERAWSEAAKALLLGTDESSGKAVCTLALDSLDAAAAKHKDDAIVDYYRDGCLTALAGAVGKYDLDDQINARLEALGSLHPQTGTSQEKKAAFDQELILANLIASCRHGDAALAKSLIGADSFAALPPDMRATGYFQYAQLLEAGQQWNNALSYYKKVIDLGGADAAAAHLQRYSILKQVQDPLNIGAAIDELKAITEGNTASPEYAKAVEELFPLLIFSNKTDEAVDLASFVANWRGGPDIEWRTVEQLGEVGLYWKIYLARLTQGDAVVRLLSEDMQVRYWNYYELTTSYPPRMVLSDKPLLLDEPESADEYLAGLGLTYSAMEYYKGEGKAGDQLLLYFKLANGAVTKSNASRQYDATEVLESGAAREMPLVGYALAEAFPLPYEQEVKSAAQQSGVEPALIYAVIKKETNFKPDSVSSAGAQGLMQLMPDTASWLNNRYSLGLDLTHVMDPDVNIRLGAAYLRSLQDDLGDHNVRGVIHSYNGGPGNYKRWRAEYPVDQVLFTDLVPNEENETFAKKVIKYYKVYSWLLSKQAAGAD